MIDRTDLAAPLEADAERHSVFVLMHQAFEAEGPERTRYLLHAFIAIALAFGIEAFSAAIRGSADKLLGNNP